MTTVARPTSKCLPDQTRRDAPRRFLRRTVGWFARRGVRVARVLTDNGSGYISRRFQARRRARRVRLTRTRPYRPQTNGKAERFIQTLIRGWAYAVAYPSSWRRTPRSGLGFGTTTSSGRTPRSAINHRASAFRGSRSEQPCQKSQLATELPS